MSGDQGARAIIANCDHADHWFCCTDCALEAVVTALREQQGQQLQVPIEPATTPSKSAGDDDVMLDSPNRMGHADAGVSDRPTTTPCEFRCVAHALAHYPCVSGRDREHVADCSCHPEIADVRCMELWKTAAPAAAPRDDWYDIAATELERRGLATRVDIKSAHEVAADRPATTPSDRCRDCCHKPDDCKWGGPGDCGNYCGNPRHHHPGAGRVDGYVVIDQRADAGVSDEALARALRAEWPPHVPRSDEFWLDYAKRVRAALAGDKQ